MPADALPPGRPMPGRANSGRPTPGSSSSGPSTLGHGLDRLFSPRSIAVVGASDRPGSFGLRTLTNLEAFEGELIPINPRRAAEGGEILGRPARASVSALEAPPDLVVIATPKETVQGVVEEAAAKGAGGAVVFASGFQELGTPEGIAAQQALTRAARAGGMRLTGPNTIGFVNFKSRAGAVFLSDLKLEVGFEADPASRRIGLVSQSGALGLALTQAMMQGRFFSHALTMGNSADVDVADCIAYLAADPDCRAIACNFEGHPDPRRVAAAARLASDAGKPLIVYKMATGEAGATAAASHTGNLAGSHEAYRTMFEHSGAVMVDQYEDLLETADFFARAKPAKGEGMAVVATSGGAAIMAADAAEAHDVPLPQPDAELHALLEETIPEFGSAANPCDVTAQVINDMPSLIRCSEGFLERDDYGAMMMPHLFAYESSFARIPVLDELGGRHGKLICTIWMSSWMEGPGLRELLEKPNTAVFHSLDRCFATFAAWRRWLRREALTAGAAAAAPEGAREAAAQALAASPGAVVAERGAKPVFAAYGVDAIGETAVDTAAAARAAAEAAGFPAVLKLDAPDLAHKTEVGGVALGLADGEAVAAAFEAMMAAARAAGVTPRGALVQRMAAKGVEMVIGGRVDPVFGPLVVAGIGGTMVEVLKDTVVAPAPVTEAQAARMLERLRLGAMLDGVRDLPAVDRAALARTVAAVSEFLWDFRDEVAEIDLNPVICRGGEITAVDALILRREG